MNANEARDQVRYTIALASQLHLVDQTITQAAQSGKQQVVINIDPKLSEAIYNHLINQGFRVSRGNANKYMTVSWPFEDGPNCEGFYDTEFADE